jgi:hypothetical protein
MTHPDHRRWSSVSAKALLVLLLTASTEAPSAFSVGRTIGTVAVLIFLAAVAIAAWPEKKTRDREKPDIPSGERNDTDGKQ